MSSIIALVFMLAIFAIGIATLALWIWMLVDCASKEPEQGNDKLIWILVIVLTGWVGALIYLLVRRPERVRIYGQ